MSIEIGVKAAGASVYASIGNSPKQDQATTTSGQMMDRAGEDLARSGELGLARRHDSLDALLTRPSPLDRFRDSDPDVR